MSKTSKKTEKLQFTENSNFLILIFISFILCVFFIVSYKITFDDDFFWHLSSGKYIYENKVVPDKDVFGHVTFGTEWIPFEWAWDTLVYLLYKSGGYNAILMLRSILLCITFLLYLFVLKKLKINYVISFILSYILLFAMMDRFSARPHIISYLFTTLLLFIYLPFKYGIREDNLKRLYLLPIIFLIWGNMHMGVLIGVLIMFVLLTSEILIFYFPERFSTSEIKAISKDQLVKLFLISAACVLILLINPHGINTYIYTYNHLQMKMMNSIAEWQNPFTGKIESNFITTLYKCYLLCGILIIIYSYIKKDLTAAFICLAFTIHSVRAARYTVDYEVTVTPFLAISINYFLTKIKSNNNLLNKILYNKLTNIFLIFLFSFTAFFAGNSKIYDFLKYYRVSGWGINEAYIPLKVFGFMKENNIKGTSFNQYEVGGYLIWFLPDEKNFIDSRALGDEIFDEFNSIFYMKPGFDKKLEKYGVDYMVFYDPELTQNPGSMTKNIVSYFSKNENWKLVYWDDQSMLFLKNVPKFSETIDKYNYSVLNPYNAIFQKKLFEELVMNNHEKLKTEIDRKFQNEPDSYFFKQMQTTTSRYLH